MKTRHIKFYITYGIILLFLLPQFFLLYAKAQETVKISLEFDATSTKSEIRIDVVISPSEAVGAFQAEYGYNPDYLQLKSVTSNSGGEVYTSDEKGIVSVIYMNKAPASERVLTLKFKVLKDGDSSVTAYYLQILSSENSPVEFVNSNDCEISVTSTGVTSTSKAASKTSSSSSGKVSVIKDDEGKTPTVEKTTENQSGFQEFFSFQSDNPAFWALCGAMVTAAVVLIIFTSYKMGVKKAQSDKETRKSEDTDEDS